MSEPSALHTTIIYFMGVWKQNWVHSQLASSQNLRLVGHCATNELLKKDLVILAMSLYCECADASNLATSKISHMTNNRPSSKSWHQIWMFSTCHIHCMLLSWMRWWMTRTLIAIKGIWAAKNYKQVSIYESRRFSHFNTALRQHEVFAWVQLHQFPKSRCERLSSVNLFSWLQSNPNILILYSSILCLDRVHCMGVHITMDIKACRWHCWKQHNQACVVHCWFLTQVYQSNKMSQ